MSDKFLGSGQGSINLSNGSATIYSATLGAASLTASKPIKTNSVKQLISANLDITDVNNLQTQLNEKDELTFVEDDTHTNPTAGKVKLYVKTDGNFYKKDSAGNELIFGGGGGVSTTNAPVVDNSVVFYDGTTGNLIKYVNGIRYDAVNNTLEVNDLETANTFSLNGELQKISNITSATQGTPNITVFDGEIDVKVIKSATHNVELEFDNKTCNLTADGDINLVTATGDIELNGNSITLSGPTVTYNGNSIDFWRKKSAGNFYIGNLSGNSQTTSNNNIGIGINTLEINQTGNDNISIGAGAGKNVLNCSQNIAIGGGAGFYKQGATCISNISIGILSQQGVVGSTTGQYNNSLGNSSLYSLTTGSFNTCIGNNAGYSITTGTNNTFIGTFCADGNADDIGNTAIGRNCLTNGGTNRTCLGQQAQTDADNQISLGNASVTQIINTGDTTCDIGSSSHRFRDIYYSRNLIGPTAPPTKFVYDLSFGTALIDNGFSSSNQANVVIKKVGNKTYGDFFISYARTTPTSTEVKLDANTTGSLITTLKYIHFRDSGGLPLPYQSSELYDIAFDAGANNTWIMTPLSFSFEHSGTGTFMYDRLGIQSSSDNVTYTNVSLDGFYTSTNATPPWSDSRAATTGGYIFPKDTTDGIALVNKDIAINARYIKFYFRSDLSTELPGWDITLKTSDVFTGALSIKNLRTTANAVYTFGSNSIVQNSGTDIEVKYSFEEVTPINLNFSGSIPLENYTTPPNGYTELSRNTSQISLTGDLSVSSLLVNGQPVSGSVAGITSQDNGGGDIEISFTGSDYKTNGYLTVDTNGRIQVTPSIQVTNAEYDAIALKWTNERANGNDILTKIYLPAGVPVGGFNHTIHNVYIFTTNTANTSKAIYDVRFIGYQSSATTSQTVVNNVNNATEIYTNSSTAHPGNVINPNEKQHIINHFTSDYNHANYPNFSVTTITRVAVLTGDVGNWSETKPFWVVYGANGNPPQPGSTYIITLYGSQNGYVATLAGSNIPAGYTEIF